MLSYTYILNIILGFEGGTCFKVIKRGIDAVRIYILGLGFRAVPKARGTRSICTWNPNPVSKSTRLALKFLRNVS